jgi:putative tryptophan/tyrosine transport system substrate-binding protein
MVVSIRTRISPKPLCTENSIFIDYVNESPNVSGEPALAAELVRRDVAVIVSPCGPGVPGQSGDCNDPGCIQYRRRPNRELNLISNLNRPDGNVTGVPFFAAQLLAKQVAPLRSMLPSASLFGVLVNPNNLRRQAGADEVQDATRTVGVKTDVVNARTVTELEVGF